jgi:hypothetical protein
VVTNPARPVRPLAEVDRSTPIAPAA